MVTGWASSRDPIGHADRRAFIPGWTRIESRYSIVSGHAGGAVSPHRFQRVPATPGSAGVGNRADRGPGGTAKWNRQDCRWRRRPAMSGWNRATRVGSVSNEAGNCLTHAVRHQEAIMIPHPTTVIVLQEMRTHDLRTEATRERQMALAAAGSRPTSIPVRGPVGLRQMAGRVASVLSFGRARSALSPTPGAGKIGSVS